MSLPRLSKESRKSVVGTAFAIIVAILGGFQVVNAEQVRSAARPARTSIRRVLLISIDGMHALDLANFIRSEPDSNLARLTATGITYTEAFTSKPSDSFPGLMSIVTGGSPISTGIWYEGTYARALSPPGSNCATKGVEVVWDGSIDRDKKQPDGGGIDPTKLPLDPARSCRPVYPHDYLRVNTIFEVAHAAGMRTAWCDKHPSYDMVRGPSGQGVDDLFTPEINATNAVHNLEAAEAYDDTKVEAVLNEIGGKDHSGTSSPGTPALFGLALQEVSVAQKLASGGYRDGVGTPSPAVLESIRHADAELGRLSEALRARGLADTTLIVVTAKHGESPIDAGQHQIVADSIVTGIIQRAKPGVLALAYQDGDLASIWLKDQRQTEEVVKVLTLPENRSEADIERILAGESLKLMFNDPKQDERTPDIVLIPRLGGLYLEQDSKFISEHGGFNDEDTHVALLLANPDFTPRVIKTPVETTQIAPTILVALGLDPQALQAVRQELTRPLPGFPFTKKK